MRVELEKSVVLGFSETHFMTILNWQPAGNLCFSLKNCRLQIFQIDYIMCNEICTQMPIREQVDLYSVTHQNV